MTEQRQRVKDRRDAVRVAEHLRSQEGKSVAQIAEALGHSPSTIRSYLNDPDGEKSRALKERYRGRCANCRQPTSGGDGKGRARRGREARRRASRGEGPIGRGGPGA